MKITLLDVQTLGKELDFSILEKFGQLHMFDKTSQEEVHSRIEDSDIVIVNKVKLCAKTLKNAKKLKLICVFATGFDNIDTLYCKEKGIAVCNVKGYSTDSVAQLTVCMALALSCRLKEFNEYVESGSYTKSDSQNYLEPLFYEMSGKVWGIIGCGNIGSKVGKIAEALGCKVLAYKRGNVEHFKKESLPQICKTADIISVHVPLNDESREMIDKNMISLMKKSVLLINVARGAVIDEKAIADAIVNGEIGGFAADVYSTEPLSENNPIYKIRNFKNVCLTPHMGWGALEARKRCLEEIGKNIEAFLKGEKRNRVD